VSRAIEGPADVMALIRGGAARLAVIDVQRVGGLANARRCGTIAQAAGIGASLSAGPSVGIAMAAMLQLAAATPAFTGCIECPQHRPVDDLAIEDFETVDGMIAVPQGPGIGIEVDRVRVEQYHVG
ncbi:MAG: enolase C-terminal domain-like protein, partial [Planctomycetota bacterium]|nr:enolase C-terminal domain-like protein [Planctomycetota bacterium]